jgi:hypothetical protein
MSEVLIKDSNLLGTNTIVQAIFKSTYTQLYFVSAQSINGVEIEVLLISVFNCDLGQKQFI